VKKNRSIKLRLSKETLAKLDTQEMLRVAGGVSAYADTDCSDCAVCPFSRVAGCSNNTKTTIEPP
jgi:natural product precursor